MDALTHVFLPLTVAYVVFPDRFSDPRAFALGGLGLLPDADKLFGAQGTFHSVVLVAVAGAALLAAERLARDELTHAPLAAALLASHLLLDLLDGGPIFLLAPGLSPGVGLTFPATISMGASPTSVAVARPLPDVTTNPVHQGPNTYSLITGYGVLSALVFAVVLAGTRVRAAAER